MHFILIVHQTDHTYSKLSFVFSHSQSFRLKSSSFFLKLSAGWKNKSVLCLARPRDPFIIHAISNVLSLHKMVYFDMFAHWGIQSKWTDRSPLWPPEWTVYVRLALVCQVQTLIRLFSFAKYELSLFWADMCLCVISFSTRPIFSSYIHMHLKRNSLQMTDPYFTLTD